MVAHAFDDGGRAVITHGEPLAGEPAEERSAARGAVLRRRCRRSRSARQRASRPPTGARRARRPTGPCRHSRSRRRTASARSRREERAEGLPGRARKRTRTVPSGNPSGPVDALTSSAESIDRGAFPFRTATRSDGLRSSSAARPGRSGRVRRARARRVEAPPCGEAPCPRHGSGRSEQDRRSKLRAFQWSPGRRPTGGRRGRQVVEAPDAPSCAISARTSSARKKPTLTTCPGAPAKRARSTGYCVATPTGHVFRWQARIITQPVATSAAVPNPISSAPSKPGDQHVAPRHELPVGLDPDPGAKLVQHERLRVSARPISQGIPAQRIDERGDAPVPPSDRRSARWSAFAFATPAATVPAPASATSFTGTSASGFA